MALQVASRRVARRQPQKSMASPRRIGVSKRSLPVRVPMRAVRSSPPLIKRPGSRTFPAARRVLARNVKGNLSKALSIARKYGNEAERYWLNIGQKKRKSMRK